MTAPTTNSTPTGRRRFRVSRGFGRPPRFVLASSMLFARLRVRRLVVAS